MIQMMFVKILRVTVAASLLSCMTLMAADEKSATPAAKPVRKPGTKWDSMEHGPFLSSHLDTQPRINKAVSLNLGNGATVAFDTEMCKLALAWTDGFVRLPTGRDGLEGMPRPDSTNIIFTTPAGPGWADADGNFLDGRPEFKGRKYGPLPREHAKWKGIYLDGDKAVLSYTVGNGRNMAGVLEQHSFDPESGTFSRSIVVTKSATQIGGKNAREHQTVICEGKGSAKIYGDFATIVNGDRATVIGKKGDGMLELTTNKTVVLVFDRSYQRSAHIWIWSGSLSEVDATKSAMTKRFVNSLLPKASVFTKGGTPRWGAPFSVPGKVSTNTSQPYVVDTLTVPETNRFNSWIRCSGLDFFKGGRRAAVCSVSGDVWLIDNIDDKLDRVTWQRFATGLFQPLGLKIVDEKVYVLGRDQITRLHDLNKDGEADFYENFNNDVAAFLDYHEFALDLQTDSKGNFYFAKGGNLGDAKHPHNGCVIKVSKDGSKLETVANGLRAPNGMGIGPNDEISVSDNEGNWVPASRFSIIKQGGFYGHVNNAFKTPKPTTYDNPVCWLPKNIDNSSGGQVWVTSKKWGPFRGDMLHMSYGHCALFKVLLDQVDGEYQGGVVKFPLKFDSGIMRGRFNERDGQLYVAGLNVWQSDGARKGAVHRVRYTGQPVNMPTKLRATKQGMELTFTSPLDEASVADVGNWAVEQWNYKWTSGYGSPEFSVTNPDKKGHDKVEVKSAKLLANKKTVQLEIPSIQPVMQMKISANVKAADGTPVKQEVWNSIWKLAGK
jgi:glucose/arabinose dehydrogenase